MSLGSQTPFVGRAQECELVEQVLGRLHTPERTVLEICGEPGIGKTRLLDRLAVDGSARGALVCRGRATEFEHSSSFGVLIDAFDDHVAAIRPRLARAEELESFFPSLERPGDTVRPVERHRLYPAVRDMIEVLATPAGLVLCLDDLHWADQATTELLAYLLRRPPRAAVLVAVAYRARQAAPHLHAALHGRSTVQIEVGPLSPAEADELLGNQVNRSRRQTLYRDSGGNPFYLQALAASNTVSPGPITNGDDGGPPSMVRRALLAEFAALSPATVRLAWAAAVVGDPFDARLAATAADMTYPDALTSVDQLLARDLVRPTDYPHQFRYRHPLLRHVAYQAADVGYRVAAHSRVAATLADQNAPATVRARHVESAAQPGDLAAVDTLIAGARKVVHSAPSEAAHWLTVALRLLPHDNPRRHLLFDLAQAQCLAGHLRASRATAHQLLDDLTDTSLRAKVVTFCAMVERLLGRHSQARGLILHELSGQADGPTAALMLELATGSLMRSDFQANRIWAERALDQARLLDDRPIQATALGFLAMASYSAGDVTTSGQLLDEAALFVDGMPDGQFTERLDAALWVSWNEIYLERYRDAVRHLDRALALAQTSGALHLLPLLHGCLVVALRWLGRLPQAAVHAEEALDVAYLTGSDELIAMAHATRSWIAVWVGDLPLAIQAGKEAVASAQGLESWFHAIAEAMLARARLAAGEQADCVRTILTNFGGPELPAIDPWSRVSWWEGLIRAELAEGQIDAAWGWVARIEASADQLGLAGHRALALLARAQVLVAHGKTAESADLAKEAAEAFDLAGCKVDAGRSHLLAGMVSADRAQLRLAQALLNECGAVELVRLARREQRRLDALSSQPNTTAGTGIEALTRRQRMVAVLVAEGLTNREIARRLDVTTKTVEMHLAQAFVKLGVTSRAAVAARVSQTP